MQLGLFPTCCNSDYRVSCQAKLYYFREVCWMEENLNKMFLISFISMKRETNNESIFTWFEEIWEAIEVQFYGIFGALLFFLMIYLFFQPAWMKPLTNIFLIR